MLAPARVVVLLAFDFYLALATRVQILRNVRYQKRSLQQSRRGREISSGAEAAKNTGGLWQLPRVENVNAGSRVIFHVARDQNEIVSQRGAASCQSRVGRGRPLSSSDAVR